MNKKEKEYHSVFPLIEKYGFSLIEREENERPDFVVHNKDGLVVGIEVTEVRDKSRYQIESTVSTIDKLLEKYTNSRKNRFKGMYSVGIYPDIIYESVQIKQHEKQLFEELDALISGSHSEGAIVKRVTRHNDTPLSVTLEPGIPVNVHALPQQWLDNVVSDKAKKLVEYQSLEENIRLGVHEYWLIVLAPPKEGWELSARLHTNISSGYSKIYISDGSILFQLQ